MSCGIIAYYGKNWYSEIEKELGKKLSFLSVAVARIENERFSFNEIVCVFSVIKSFVADLDAEFGGEHLRVTLHHNGQEGRFQSEIRIIRKDDRDSKHNALLTLSIIEIKPNVRAQELSAIMNSDLAQIRERKEAKYE